MTPGVQSRSTLREYLGTLRRRWRYLVGAILVAVAVAAAYSYTRTPLYESIAQLTYQRQADITSLITGSQPVISSIDVQRELETQASLMATVEMADRAGKVLGPPTPAEMSATISALPVKDTSVLQIRAVSTDPEAAKLVASAYAEAFISWRKQIAIDQYKAALKVLAEKLALYITPTDKADPAYGTLVSQQQELSVLKDAATGNFMLVAAPQLPDTPFYPKHARDLVLGLLSGLMVGVLLVATAEQLDVRIHSQDEISQATQLPIIGRLPRVSRDIAHSNKLAVLEEPHRASAEAFRMLRGNLDFVDIDAEVKSIMFTSPTEGEGKTTTASNLAVTAARSGKRVILVDCDLRRPKCHYYFDLPNRYGVSTVVSGRSSLEGALQPVPVPTAREEADVAGRDVDGDRMMLQVLTAGPLPPNPGEIVTSRKLAALLADLSSRCDLLLVDSPPFLAVGDAAALAKGVGGMIVVMRLGTVTKSILKDSVEFFEPLPCRRLGVVLTNIPLEAKSHRYRYYEADNRDEPASESDAAMDQSLPQPLTRA